VAGSRKARGLSSNTVDRIATVQFTIDLVGHPEKADRVQKYTHSAIGVEKPLGWYNQLRTALGFILNTFRSSHSVDRNAWVEDFQVCVVMSLWGMARVSLHIFRSREFDQQDTFSSAH
jgi:hypothetical protein